MFITEALIGLLVPLGICVALPVLIIWLISRTETNKDNRNAEIIIKAIESDTAVDTDKLVEALGKRKKSPLEVLHARLLRGCIFTFTGIAAAIVSMLIPLVQDLYLILIIVSALCLAIGIAYIVVYFITRKSVSQQSDND